MHKKERNVTQFNKDVSSLGTYVYTTQKKYSAVIARKTQHEEIMRILKKYFSPGIAILDAGCGDGTFAFDLIKEFRVRRLLGFDVAKEAVEAAVKRIPKKDKKLMNFKTISIYESSKEIKKSDFDVTIIWGVFHHLYYPEKAIKQISLISDNVIVLETNGYNPLLKIIEKVSPYHRAHEEKSYWPPTLHSWFRKNGYELREEVYCGIVPYFCPTFIAKALKLIEPIVEKTPLLNKLLCGSNALYYTK